MKDYQGYFIDLDGTVYKGKDRIPAAARFIRRLQAAKKTILFVTNNSTRQPSFVADNLAHNHDIHVSADNVYTSALATADYLDSVAGNHRKVYMVGESGLKKALQDKQFQITNDNEDIQPDFVVVGLDTNTNYHKLEQAVLDIRAGARFVGTNGDSNLPNEKGMTPGAGSLVKLVEYATQKKPLMVGKPQTTIMKMALQRCHLNVHDVLMVGDNYHTDIEAGINIGMDTLLVYTGLSRPSDVAKEKVQPTYTVETLDDWQVE
jgi:4-nitrophenyl phosphatase